MNVDPVTLLAYIHTIITMVMFRGVPSVSFNKWSHKLNSIQLHSILFIEHYIQKNCL